MGFKREADQYALLHRKSEITTGAAGSCNRKALALPFPKSHSTPQFSTSTSISMASRRVAASSLLLLLRNQRRSIHALRPLIPPSLSPSRVGGGTPIPSMMPPLSSSIHSTLSFKRGIQIPALIQAQQMKNESEKEEDAKSSTMSSLREIRASSKLKTSARHDLAMVFTCRVCETRSVKTVCRESYEKGVVVARCAGCDNLHLIADRLGWFGQPGSVEDFLATRGEEVVKGSADTLGLTLEDLAGTSSTADSISSSSSSSASS